MKIDAVAWAGAIQSSIGDLGFRHEAAQVQAKALLSRVVTELPPFRWTYIPQRIAKNMALLTFQLRKLAQVAPEQVAGIQDAVRDVAFLWEALAQIREGAGPRSALLNAAVAYELAGFQANAASLARQLDSHSLPPLMEATKLFLQRRLVRLRAVAASASGEPDPDRPDIIGDLGTALALEGLSHASSYLMRGDKQLLREATSSLASSARMFDSGGAYEAANLVSSLASLIPTIRERSTWKVLAPQIAVMPQWERYLKLLARGVSGQPFFSRSVVELWPSQLQAISGGLLATNSSKVVKMPTSAGKTRIAELAIVNTLLGTPGAKCVYVAPYKALVSELHHNFLGLFCDLGFRVSSVVGTYESDDFEELLFDQADLIVTTPEKLDLLLRAQPQVLENLRLVVLDETQVLDDESRGVKFELLLSRLMRRIPAARYIALSAVIPQETLEDFAAWFRARPTEDIINSTWRPAAQRIARFEWRGTTGVLRFPRDANPVLAEFVPGVIEQREYEYENPGTGRMRRTRFPDPESKAQVAAELAFRLAEQGPVLVFCPQQNFVDAVAKALAKRLELTALTGQQLPSYFQRPITRSASVAQEWMRGRPAADWLSKGIGIHHGMLPDVLRAAIEEDFRQRRLRVVVATNTLAQGVNLPVRSVILHSCSRYQDTTWTPIPARDYWNIAGRAGRAGEETDGLIVHITLTRQDRELFESYLGRRDHVEPVQSALYSRLQDLIAHRISPEALGEILDPEVLGILAEEANDEMDKTLTDTIATSLFDVQARRLGTNADPLIAEFRRTATTLVQRAPSQIQRVLYSATGLSSRSCESIVQHARANIERLRSVLFSPEAESWRDLVRLIAPVVFTLQEMEAAHDFSGDRLELLDRWIGGAPLGDLLEAFQDQVDNPEELGKFIDESFRYLLPWGVAAYTRLAWDATDTDRDLAPDHIRFLPSMIKFGLPDSIACWAMAAGVPYRDTALRIAEAFRREEPESSQRAFVRWLGRLSADRLRHEFAIESPFLEDVVRSLYLAGDNPLIREFISLQDFLPREIEVQGIRYDGRERVAFRTEVGAAVSVRRDYDNLVDTNAIAVVVEGDLLGYFPRDVAQVLAAEIDTGSLIVASIVRIERSSPPRIWVRIEASA